MLSPAEESYILSGINKHSIRLDGRHPLQYRPNLTIETAVVQQSNGSCKVELGNTHILTGVKLEIDDIHKELIDQQEDEETEAEADGSNKGRVVVNVNCTTSINSLDEKAIENQCIQYSQYLTRLLNGPQGGVDLNSLVIVPNSKCWVIYIDALILEYDGNLVDTILISIRSALNNTRLPKCTIDNIKQETMLDGEDESSKRPIVEFEVSDEETEVVCGWREVPVCVTVYKIGDKHIIDATPIEELVCETSFMICVNRKGNVCSIQKNGDGDVDPSLIGEMIQTAKRMGLDIIAKMDKVLLLEEERVFIKRAPSIGFSFK